jgi:hypothetical protein
LGGKNSNENERSPSESRSRMLRPGPVAMTGF